MGAVAYGQRSAPLADSVNRPLVPAGISDLRVNLNGQRAYLFKTDEGTNVVHVVGDFVASLGGRDGQRITSREAVVWITDHSCEGRPYRHYQILLWRDATVRETGGTWTSGPVLFVTFSSFGELTADADDLAFESSADTPTYQQGDAIRRTALRSGVIDLKEDAALRVFDASGVASAEPRPGPRAVVFFRSEGTIDGPRSVGDQQVLTVVGGAYLSRGVAGAGDHLEIRADSVVVFLPADDDPALGDDQGLAGLGGTERAAAEGTNLSDGSGRKTNRRRRDTQMMSAGFGDVAVEAVYLEGDVVMTQGPNMIRASRLYYDFRNERALILDAVVRATIIERNIPMYIRAKEIRQLASNRFSASDALVTTSEFHTPHYHVGAERVELINRTPPGPGSRQTDLRAGSFRIHGATLNVAGTPILYWPNLRGDIETSETAVRAVRTGFSDDFGLELETDWHLFNVLGLITPSGFDATLSLDYFTRRGPAVGAEANYVRDRYFGRLDSYLLFDSEEDFLGRDREETARDSTRGRFLLRHRQYLEEDWQLSLEVSYISDEGFLEEFFESEFDNDKEQETLLYLKKQHDHWAFTALLQARILDFTTQTERYPDLGWFLVGESLDGGATLFSENRLGFVRYRPEEQTFLDLLREGRTVGSGTVARVDSRQEVGRAVDVGPVRLVPFASVRGSVWDDSPAGGGMARVFASYGVRGSMYLSRVFPEIRSSLFDVDGVRHIIKPDITAWGAHTNRNSSELFPFDEQVEGIDEFDGVTIGARQRWQTKRGAGDNRRIVDFLTFDVDAGFFSGARGEAITNGFASFSRPENSIARNYVNSSLIWRVNDRTALLSELNYDVNDGEVDILNVSLAVERSPRLSYLLGYRFIEESDSNLLGFDMNYRFTEKHTMAVRERFDLERGRTLDFTIALIRKFPRWFGALTFQLDEPEDDFGISFSLWPEGLPSAGLGSRRFTGIGKSTRIRG